MKKDDLNFINSIAKIKNRVAVKDYYFDQLPKELRELAFTVSNLETLSQVNIVKRSLENAQREGLSFAEWKNQLDRDVVRDLSRSRLETVYRTNMASSYSKSTRFNALTSDVTPYLMFTAVGDSRTRPEHEALDGIIKRADSPFWDKYTPPLGFNCRCSAIPLSKSEAERRGISRKSLDNLPEPDSGFGESSLGDMVSGANEQARHVADNLPINSPFRQKFEQAQQNNKSLVDVWWQQNQNIFNEGY